MKQDDLFPKAERLPPFVRRSDTSKAAAVSMIADARTLRDAVLQFVLARHSQGATCHEVEWKLKLPHQTASARLRELVLAGKLQDSGQRRPTASGRKAVVWVRATPPAGADEGGADTSRNPSSNEVSHV